MLFNSAEYLFFFVGVLVASWLVVGLPRLRIVVLLLASYWFYTSNNGWLILLIVISTQIDYLAGIRIEDSDDNAIRKRYLVLSICTNLGILAFFKYANFFASSAVELFGAAGVELSWTDLHVVLPVGISFYTFQSMSYTIDVYRRQLAAERSWIRFSFYVAYFPQLIAGPIMRASHFIPQIPLRPRLDVERLESSLSLIALGLVKKIVLADMLGRYADVAFDDPNQVGAVSAWLGLYAFTFQIYFDFSGYSDVAIGCSRLMGYEIPENFRRPYVATGFSDFWRRWHISLSQWLRDYLYIPLGGNRMATSAGVYRNLMLTMLLGGLWHGAAWHFVVWGGLHGVYLAAERFVRGLNPGGPNRDPSRGARLLVRRVLVFHAVVLTWLVFRCESMGQVGDYLVAMMRVDAAETITLGMALAALIIAGGWAMQQVNERFDALLAFERLPLMVRGACFGAVAAAVALFNAAGAEPFIYFRF